MHIHKYEKWEDGNKVSVYTSMVALTAKQAGDMIPDKEYLVQTKRCKRCGKKKSRRILI